LGYGASLIIVYPLVSFSTSLSPEENGNY
jgi:hypothetical protein